jgi:hypothetical protein
MAYLNAVARGDAAKARACAVGSEQDKQWIDGMVALLGGLRNYDQALVARFGQQAVPVDVDLKQAIFSMANQPIIRFQDGIVKESENTAEIDAAVGHIRLMAQRPVYLKRLPDGWKVDLETMRQDPHHGSDAIGQYVAASKALNAAARDIRAGRYRTLDEAQQAIDQQTGI